MTTFALPAVAIAAVATFWLATSRDYQTVPSHALFEMIFVVGWLAESARLARGGLTIGSHVVLGPRLRVAHGVLAVIAGAVLAIQIGDLVLHG